MNTFTLSLCCSRAMDGAFLRCTRLPAHSVWGPKRSLLHFYQAASSDNEGLLPQKQCQARHVWHIRQLPSWQLTFPSNNHQQVETGPLQNNCSFQTKPCSNSMTIGRKVNKSPWNTMKVPPLELDSCSDRPCLVWWVDFENCQKVGDFSYPPGN